jgi:hemerythrin-like domain-containing protein
MMPIGPLMIEHRLIERMIALIKKEWQRIEAENTVQVTLIENMVDFIRMYADRCHHGKEEDILFRDLEKKDLPNKYQKTMQELIQEHVYGRKTVGKLVAAKEQYVKGNSESLGVIKEAFRELIEFYPKHIEKEDKHFFIPCMDYFTQEEQDQMLREFWDFDKKLIHEKYKKLVETLESEK